MLRFPIHWKIVYSDILNSQSNLDLNDECTLSCAWELLRNSYGNLFYKLNFIEIGRKTNFEESSISGRFSFFINSGLTPGLTFSKLIESGSASTILIDLQTGRGPRLYQNSAFHLSGVINIISVSEKCASDSETKCCHLYFIPKSLEQLSDDFERLLDPQTPCNADVNLKCGNSSIPAHKLVLSARSPVFAAMLKTPVKETRRNEAEMNDIDPSVLQAMLNYIYSGKTSDLTFSMASDLLFAADKYQLPDLKRVCCDFLKESISLQNAMRILNLGDLYDENLKSFSIDYICQDHRNFAEFEKLEEWQTLRKEKPALAVGVLESVLKSKDNVLSERNR